MRCARCGFRLQALVLNLATGLMKPGQAEPATCPGGCGPLWPMTWEQETRECWRLMRELEAEADAAKASHQAADAGWRREADDLDDVLRLVGLKPDEYRSEGGNLMLAKVAKALRSRGLQAP